MSIDFEKLALNLEPEFAIWRTGQGGPAAWALVADATAAGGRAIAQTSTDKTDYRFPLAIYKPYSAQNLEVSARFKPVAGTVDQAGGLAVRLQTPDDYYVVRANALEDNERFYRVVGGKREQLADANTKVTGNSWHTLTLTAEGDRFTVAYDGKQLFTARDATFPAAGKVALWTKADSVTHFDSLTIRPLSERGKMGPGAVAAGSPPAIDLDTAALDQLLGAKGTNNGGIYQFSIPRVDPIKDAGMTVPAAMGSANAINFQPTGGGKAAVTGDFVLTDKEVAPVIKALRDNGIEVTAVHNHMLDEQPRLFFMHFWANDDAKKLGQGLKAALSHINIARR